MSTSAPTARSAPVVSVVIPTRSRPLLTQAAIQSVIDGSYADWEAIVVVDGDEDDTADAVRRAFGHDGRVQVHERTGAMAGAPVCRNQGWERARGEYVVFLDSDDLLAPWALAERVAVLDSAPHLDFVVSAAELFAQVPGDLGVAWNLFDDRDDLERFLLWDICWQTAGPLWRRTSVARLRGWDEHAWCWQDWEFHVRALAAGMAYAKLPGRDLFVRRDPAQADQISRAEPSGRGYGERALLYGRVYQAIRGTVRWRPIFRDWLVDGVWTTLLLRRRYYNDSWREVADLWDQVGASGLIPWPRWMLGRLTLRAVQVRGGARVMTWIAGSRIKEHRAVGRGETFLRAAAPMTWRPFSAAPRS